MIKFIIHLSKYVYKNGFTKRPTVINKRIEISSDDMMVAYNKAIELNPGFSVNMIAPEYRPVKKEFTLFDSINESLRCFPVKIG